MAEAGDERQIAARPLQVNDIPFVVALEQASFPRNEAATPEKVWSSKRRIHELMADRIPYSNVS